MRWYAKGKKKSYFDAQKKRASFIKARVRWQKAFRQCLPAA